MKWEFSARKRATTSYKLRGTGEDGETVQLCLTAVCREAVPAVRSIPTGHSLFDPFEVGVLALTCIHRRYRCAAHSG